MKKVFINMAALILLAAPAWAGTVKTDGADIIIRTKGGFEVKTADGAARFQIGGRLQWDYDSTSSDLNETDDFDVRRARIFFKGHYGDWGYKAQFNVAESAGSKGGHAEDLYIRYMGLGKLANITVGKQQEPFGMEYLTSSKDVSALERSALTEKYARGRSAGVQLHGAGENWTYAIGLFEADGDSADDFADVALTGRVTYVPVKTDKGLVHVGLAYTDVGGQTAADESDALAVELAGAYQSFHAKAEFFDGTEGGQDSDGYYVQLAWVITGESRPYKKGLFKRVKPNSKMGAWETVLRYEDGTGKYSDIGLGTGEGTQTTYGVNYYANDHVRLGLSYMDGELSHAGGTLAGDELRFRIQLVY